MKVVDHDYKAHFCEDEENGKRKVWPPSVLDWENFEFFVEFLKAFYDVTLPVSDSKLVTSNSYLADIVNIQRLFITWSVDNQSILRNMTIFMEAKFDK